MKRRKWQRVLRANAFTLHQALGEPRTFSVRWKKTAGDYGERVFHAPDLGTAVEQAPVICGLAAPVAQRKTITLAEAFEAALAASIRGESARKDWHVAVRRFAKWLVEHHPGVGNWNQLSRSIVREYQASLGNLSPNGQRMALQPIQQTDGHMAREHGFQRVADGLRISHATQKPPARVYVADVVEFCDFLCEMAAQSGDETLTRQERDLHRIAERIEAAVALQGLAGLRLQEAFRLTWDRVDLHRGLIEISGEVKTEWSKRIIPVCRRVIEALVRADASRELTKVVPVGPERVIEGYTTWAGYSKAVAKLLRRWNAQVSWRPKDLRNALPTWAIANGRHGDMWEQYLGHSPEGVTARHYVPRLASVTPGETGELEKQMDLFRVQIVEPIEAASQAQRLQKVPPFSTQGAGTA